jgi:hypothetical protein
MPSTERQFLIAPDVIAKQAARLAPLPEQRWMLRQARAVRKHFADQVFEREDEEILQQIWMLGQDDAVRESFIEHVLERQSPRPHQEIWMLRQPLAVRESFVREVLEPELELGGPVA